MIAVVLAVAAAACNALASVLQRRAARAVPDRKAFRMALITDLIRRPVWLGGIVALIGGFVFQAAALSEGGLALVQPILIVELPFTMILVSWMFGIRLDGRSWPAIGALTGGLALFLASASPGPGDRSPGPTGWVIATVVTVGVVVALVAVSRLLVSGAARPVALGMAAGLGFAFTATFMKESTIVFETDPGTLLTSWEPYAMVAAGLVSLFLLQNALQSGTLVAAQPALTITDPVASVVYGVALFGEDFRTGPWVVPELAGIGLIVYGSVLLAQSPPIRAQARAARER
ncbi:hypothetical protein GCM10017673_04690 [Streptosporangium violaceochromogenes]|nr:hypothetical protein GCM10017673_04690 [Streptosporangium violaceochromogenes]